MQKKTMAGWLAIAAACLVPVFLWIFLGPGSDEFSGYPSITHSLGELFGLVGITMFSITFILSTRIRAIEDVFGGLDKVYIVHGVLGGTALIFVLAHPIFLVLKFIPGDLKTAAMYLLPSTYWSVNFGIIALMGMITLIFITLFTKMKYHKWKFTHEFLGLMFIFAVLHMFLVRGDASRDFIFHGYYYYAAFVSAIGIGAFSYSLFIKNRIFKNAVYKIASIKTLKDSFEITMLPEHKPINYKSGQFIFVRFFNEKLSREPHPFSIASKSNSEEIRIIVKKLGDFTSRLVHLKVGDKVSIEGAYGRFDYRKHSGHDQVWIAGGIGIVPFLGMAQELMEAEPANKIDLYYSASQESDFIGLESLNNVAEKTSKFRVFAWNSGKQGYLSAETILKSSNVTEDTRFFLCGPPNFKNALIKSLISRGVQKDRIYEESFDFR